MYVETPFSTLFLNDTAPTELYTLSLHDALPILRRRCRSAARVIARSETRQRASGCRAMVPVAEHGASTRDRKSTRLNSSHPSISYAVFCLKKKTGTEGRVAGWVHRGRDHGCLIF